MPWLEVLVSFAKDFAIYQLMGKMRKIKNNQIFAYEVLVIFGCLKLNYGECQPCQVSTQNNWGSYGFLGNWIKCIEMALQRRYAKYCSNEIGPNRLNEGDKN